MKKLLIGILVILVLLVAALFVLPPMLGDSMIKPRIVAEIEKATGRKASIGSLDLALLPSVELQINDLVLDNAPGMSQPEMVKLSRLDLALQTLPLISKAVKLDRFVISDLAVALEKNAEGQANWVMAGEGAGSQAADSGGTASGGGLPISDLSLGDVRIEGLQLSFTDQTTGQVVEARDGEITASLPALASSLGIDGKVNVNEKPVTLAATIDTPDALLKGDPAKVVAALTSEMVALQTDLSLAQQPQPAADGSASVDIGSVGALLAWLGQPLPAEQADPGPVNFSAVFATEGSKVTLQEATLSGKALDLKATGSLEAAGDKTKIQLAVESGLLDIDSYLPPASAEPAPKAAKRDGKARRGHPLEAIPDEPIDLSALRQLEADITVAMGGIKASGYEIGPIDFATTVKDGTLNADLKRLALYGGQVTGQVALDASGQDLGLTTDMALDQVDLGALSSVGSEGPAPIAGTASGSLKAEASGASPRALVQAMKAAIRFKLGQLDVQNAETGALTGLDLAVDLPGLSQAPSVKGEVVYNKRKVALDVALDPLDKILSGETFALKAAVDSELLKLGYDGSVQQEPMPGLDGSFLMDAPSVGQLLAWLGQPLPQGQPDPGPLKVVAVLAADQGKVSIEKAEITGKAAQATASGSFDGTGEIAKFDARIDVAMLDLEAYLPESQQQEAAPAAEGQGSQGWSEEPIDASGLGQAEGQLVVNLAKVHYRDVQIQKAAATVVLQGGIMTADLTEMQLSPGQVNARVVLDGSGQGVGLSYHANLADVEAKPILMTFADFDRLSGKLTFQTQGKAQGGSQKEIVSNLNGDGALSFLDGAIEGIDLAGTLRNVGKLGLDSGGERPKTDFTELSGSFTITNGLLNNPDLKMLAPLVRLKGAGDVPLPPRTVDYKLEATLVASLEGQGGGDALAGLPIPVHIFGPWDAVDYQVDYASMLNAAAADPERLKNLPADLAGKAGDLGGNDPGSDHWRGRRRGRR